MTAADANLPPEPSGERAMSVDAAIAALKREIDKRKDDLKADAQRILTNRAEKAERERNDTQAAFDYQCDALRAAVDGENVAIQRAEKAERDEEKALEERDVNEDRVYNQCVRVGCLDEMCDHSGNCFEERVSWLEHFQKRAEAAEADLARVREERDRLKRELVATIEDLTARLERKTRKPNAASLRACAVCDEPDAPSECATCAVPLCVHCSHARSGECGADHGGEANG